MKNILSLFLFLMGFMIVTSCNQAKKETNQQNQDKEVKTGKTLVVPTNVNLETDTLLTIMLNMSKIKPEEVAPMKRAAVAIIDHRQKETGNKSHIILDKDLWEFEFIFSGRKMSAVNMFAGCWIDFSEDLTYTYGRYEEVKGSGRYHYSTDTGLLLLNDDSDKIKPHEFEAKLFDATLVMDGNDIYKDNNYNAKLKRISARPQS